MKRKLYCCATNWLHEIGEAPDLEKRMPFCSSIEKLKELSPCWEECGIVEIEATLVRWVESGDLGWQIEQIAKELEDETPG